MTICYTFTGIDDSPIRCTQDEIKKKHQQARERLLAKRLLPFTLPHSQSPSTQLTQPVLPKKTQFQPKVASKTSVPFAKINNQVCDTRSSNHNNKVDLKQLIEKKRQEALMKLRRRQPQNK